MERLAAYIPAANNSRYYVHDTQLRSLMDAPSGSYQFLPEVAVLQVIDSRGDRDYFSLIHNKALSNNAQLFGEEDRWLPQEDTLSVVSGFVGAYPNMYFRVRDVELPRFIDAVQSLGSEADYTSLVDRYGVRRTAPWFWKLNDDIHANYRSSFPSEAGLFDLNRYENR